MKEKSAQEKNAAERQVSLITDALSKSAGNNGHGEAVRFLKIADGFIGNRAEDTVRNEVEFALQEGDGVAPAAFTDCCCHGFCIYNGSRCRTMPRRKSGFRRRR